MNPAAALSGLSRMMRANRGERVHYVGAEAAMNFKSAKCAGLTRVLFLAFAGMWLASHTPQVTVVAAQSSARQAPIFEVDPFWPRPLPNHWVLGSTIGLSVDAQDHVWIIHRPGTVEDNFKAADLKV